MRRKTSLQARFQYWFDQTMSHGAIALVGWLAVVSLAGILAISFVVWVASVAPLGVRAGVGDDGAAPGYLDLVWLALMRTLDAGTMGGDHGSWWFLFAMLGITLLGIFMISTLIGVLTSAIESKIENLQRGRSTVLEHGHTVILGWSPQVFDIVGELAIAHQSVGKGRVVVLAERDMREMQEEIHERVPDLRGLKVICRTGRPMEPGDLAIVSPGAAKSIIVLHPESTHADAMVVKVLLALSKHLPARGALPSIVAELQHRGDVDAVELVGGDRVCPLVTSDVMVDLLVQSSRKADLTDVMQDLFDFDGSEIYLHEEPALVGRTFAEAAHAYAVSSLIGLQRGDEALIGPDSGELVQAGDRLILIAEDDDKIGTPVRESGGGGRFRAAAVDETAVSDATPRTPTPQRLLVLGWNARVPAYLRGIDGFLPAGTTVTILAERPVDEMQAAIPDDLTRVSVSPLTGSIDHRDAVQGLDPKSFDQVLVLPYEDDLEPGAADAITLVTLLHLRQELGDSARTRVVSEMLERRTRDLVQVATADDFVVSSHLVSLMVSQISENPALCGIFRHLLDPEGREVSIHPAEDYIELGREVNFATVLEATLRKEAIAIGYRQVGRPGREHRVVVNPAKATRLVFEPGDEIVVLAED